jgi:hypothetical protein
MIMFEANIKVDFAVILFRSVLLVLSSLTPSTLVSILLSIIHGFSPRGSFPFLEEA